MINVSLITTPAVYTELASEMDGVVFISTSREALLPYTVDMIGTGEGFSVATTTIKVAGLAIELHVLTNAKRAKSIRC